MSYKNYSLNPDGAYSLSNLSVPVQGAGNQVLLMPKLKYRFRVVFTNLGGGGSMLTELTRQVINVDRPNVQFDQIDVPVYNSTIKLAGKPQWQDVTCTIRDDSLGAVSKMIGMQLQLQQDFMEQASASSGIDYKFQCNVEVLDGGNGIALPIVLESWQLLGCFIKGANYNNLDYGESAVTNITVTLAFDNAVQLLADATYGVGANMGQRTLGDLSTGIGNPSFLGAPTTAGAAAALSGQAVQ